MRKDTTANAFADSIAHTFDNVWLNIVGPIPTSSGNSYIFVVQRLLIKYIESISAILIDQGTHFINSLFKEMPPSCSYGVSKILYEQTIAIVTNGST
jgi:hypothetical protein